MGYLVLRHLILLTGGEEARYFRTAFLESDPALAVVTPAGLTELAAAVDRLDGRARLISFLSNVIVPPRVLSKLRTTPYNIHPGPPEFPGSHAESFAIWEGAKTFGVTAHEMTARVDEGPIVSVRRFSMPPCASRTELAELTYTHAIKMFGTIAAHCAKTDQPMRRLDESWATRKRTRKQYRALCRPAHGTAPSDLERLRRACGGDVVEPVPLAARQMITEELHVS